ncbi:RagB/SusD family nutrient uptake outer membrane protein [Bacteroides sp. GM023]|uniref:RagB/SusD family nutrient uptake outer membrane protein n=1 Tax=Bacteroides sp. GM023 TaxID=2723058 RepID=UPI00168B3818|nr:RagB/SusD family nutrient uptake outer membrane protein [Bacteroides sp. GM023]MBD3590900.1 RagB/SusD family nutrient uptake outer membrane protein [Bacteroides sp. GM023]
MKAINKIIILGMVTALFSSCDLTLLPENAVTPDNYFKNKSDLELWTNQFYTLLDEPDASAGMNADDMIDKGMGQVIEGTRSAASETGWSWSKLRHINYFLQHSSNCDDETARNEYNGVAQFFRAYFYFVKVRRYGDVPWYDQVLGSEDQELLAKARDSREFVMDQVLKDFEDAATNLPAKSKESRNTRVTRWAALAFASQAALYEGTYRKYHGMDNYEKYLEAAASTAKQFIDESGFSLYKEGTEPYRDLFCADQAKATEVVLARAYNFEGLQLSHSVQFSIANLQMGFTRRFMNHYLMLDGSRFTDKEGYETMFYTDEVKGRDPRLEQTVLCPKYIQKGETTVTANDLSAYCGYKPIKFVSSKDHDGAAKSTSDWPLMRAAEVYLNYAEAKAELGTLKQEDLDISVNKIRTRAKMPDLILDDANGKPDAYLAACYPNVDQGANKGVILEIRRERTIELVMEGLRQWDLFRWKEGKQMFNHYIPYLGLYIPGVGTYDMDGDGTPDLEIYETTATSQCDNKKKLDKDIYLSNGTSGYIIGFPKVTYGKDWKEERDYLWPIPADQRVLTQGVLSQNPGWEDGLSY